MQTCNVCICAYIYTYMHAMPNITLHIFAYIYIYLHISTYIYIYLHIFTYIHTLPDLLHSGTEGPRFCGLSAQGGSQQQQERPPAWEASLEVSNRRATVPSRSTHPTSTPWTSLGCLAPEAGLGPEQHYHLQGLQ